MDVLLRDIRGKMSGLEPMEFLKGKTEELLGIIFYYQIMSPETSMSVKTTSYAYLEINKINKHALTEASKYLSRIKPQYTDTEWEVKLNDYLHKLRIYYN